MAPTTVDTYFKAPNKTKFIPREKKRKGRQNRVHLLASSPTRRIFDDSRLSLDAKKHKIKSDLSPCSDKRRWPEIISLSFCVENRDLRKEKREREKEHHHREWCPGERGARGRHKKKDFVKWMLRWSLPSL
jgi:hypothetical protein